MILVDNIVWSALQDDEEADTVGCCTLKVGNVEPMPPDTLKVYNINILIARLDLVAAEVKLILQF